jgi:transcriptional regulator with XRE-family HTH domain
MGIRCPGPADALSSPPTVRVGKYKPNLRIAELRKARGMTQAELAEKAQLGRAGRAQIARFETGSRTPTWDMLARLAAALRCKTINQLFGHMPVSPPSNSTIHHRAKRRKA